VKDLGAILTLARRGAPDAIDELAATLLDRELYVPLAKPIVERDIAVHLLSGPLGEKLLPLFTEERILSHTGHRLQWRTGGVDLQWMHRTGQEALEMALASIERGTVYGAAINPYHETALDLRPEEVRDLLHRKGDRLRRRLSAFPVRGDHAFFTGREREPGPKEAHEALEAYVAGHSQIDRFVLAGADVEGRDKPVLHVLFYCRGPIDEERVTQFGGVLVAFEED
jgi:hypothetical protein